VGHLKIWLFWPLEVPGLGILMVASPLPELALELHSTVYIAGEIIGAALQCGTSSGGERAGRIKRPLG
jgi:hypothetical protein